MTTHPNKAPLPRCEQPAPEKSPTLTTAPTNPQCRSGAGTATERENQFPRLSRNAWSRPDLARLMGTEVDYSPYLTAIPTRKPSTCS